MDTSDDALINPPKMEKPQFSAPREVFTSEDLLDPGRKKKPKAAQAVRTSEWAAPMLGHTGVLGLGSGTE